MAAHNGAMAIGIPSSPPTLPALRLGRPALAGIAAAGLGALALSLFSSWRADLFAAGAARVAAGLLGAGLRLGATGQVVVWGEGTVTVTAACSGTDFFLMVAALLGWRLARADRPLAATIPAALLGVTLAVPVTLLVNGLRIAAVAQAHRWLIPLLPERHGAFAHMLTGVAVFLPALIALNLALEFYARRHRPAASR